VILPDLNLLLYAYNPHVRQHERARAWWQSAVDGEELIGLPHEVLFGFVRIATNRRLGRAAVSLERAGDVVIGWTRLPQARVLTPSAGHLQRVMALMSDAQASGAVLSDAVLAAYAMEHRARLYTNDADFARFPGLDWVNPLLAHGRGR